MTMQQRLREETERERTPWELANEPYGTTMAWDYNYGDSYKFKREQDYSDMVETLS